MSYAILALSVLGCVTNAMAQVASDRAVLLRAGERQVYGLEAPQTGADAMTAGAEQVGDYRVADAVTGNAWSVDLPAIGTTPRPGTQVIVRAPATTPGALSVSLNGTGPYELLRADGSLMDGTDVMEGLLLSLVFDGAAFRVLNGSADIPRPCPGGSIAVDRQFCVEPTERTADGFFDAALACHADGLRLCRWGEYIAACQRSSALGLVGMTNGWEWTNSSSNEDNSVRIAGASACTSAGNSLASGADRSFRCCSSR